MWQWSVPHIQSDAQLDPKMVGRIAYEQVISTNGTNGNWELPKLEVTKMN